MAQAIGIAEERVTQNTRARELKRPSLLKEILYLFLKIAAIILVFVLMFTFLFGIYRNTDMAMTPTIKDGDLVMFYRLDRSYGARDIIVLEYKGERQVRRVVATAGDTVDITEEGLIINGAIQQELDIYSKTLRYDTKVELPLTVPMGHVFVLGDERTTAADSRVYGTVDVDNTFGKVMTILRRRNI